MLDVAWSLAIEEQFYLIWAVVVWLLSPRLLGPLCALIVLAVPLVRVLALQDGADPVDVYVLPHYRADALALGGLLAWLARRGSLERVAAIRPVGSARWHWWRPWALPSPTGHPGGRAPGRNASAIRCSRSPARV